MDANAKALDDVIVALGRLFLVQLLQRGPSEIQLVDALLAAGKAKVRFQITLTPLVFSCALIKPDGADPVTLFEVEGGYERFGFQQGNEKTN